MATLTSLPAVETPHLIMREIEGRDASAFSGYMTQPDYQRYIAVRLADAREIQAFVRRAVARQGDGKRSVFHLAAEEKLSGEAVGDGFIILQQPKAVEIGWGVHPAMWQMGLGGEIGSVLLALAFERLKADRVWCKVMTANAASLRLARRIGMRHVKSHSRYPAADGLHTDVDIFALTADQYFELAY